jgi:ribonuclease HII
MLTLLPLISIGIDEAGRGSVFGPMVVAGCVLPDYTVSTKLTDMGLNDSKKLSPKKRRTIYDYLVENALYHAEVVNAADIDTQGVGACWRAAVEVTITALPGSLIMVDGQAEKIRAEYPVTFSTGADGKYLQVAAASVIAKVTHDDLVLTLIEGEDKYDLSHNKGYGTAAHLEAVRTYGLTSNHRRSFLRNYVDT